MYMYLSFGFYTLTWRAKVRARDSCTIPIMHYVPAVISISHCPVLCSLCAYCRGDPGNPYPIVS